MDLNPSPADAAVEYEVLAAVRYLRAAGAKTVSVVGASFGGEPGANASIEADSRQGKRR
jgi:hypothetical protein